MIVWEMHHLGKLPWEGELDEDVCRKVLIGERPRIGKDVEEQWNFFIEKCWEHDPDERWSFEQVVEYLNENKLNVDHQSDQH